MGPQCPVFTEPSLKASSSVLPKLSTFPMPGEQLALTLCGCLGDPAPHSRARGAGGGARGGQSYHTYVTTLVRVWGRWTRLGCWFLEDATEQPDPREESAAGRGAPMSDKSPLWRKSRFLLFKGKPLGAEGSRGFGEPELDLHPCS